MVAVVLTGPCMYNKTDTPSTCVRCQHGWVGDTSDEAGCQPCVYLFSYTTQRGGVVPCELPFHWLGC